MCHLKSIGKKAKWQNRKKIMKSYIRPIVLKMPHGETSLVILELSIDLKIFECLLCASTVLHMIVTVMNKKIKHRRAYKGVCDILEGIFSLKQKQTQKKKRRKNQLKYISFNSSV